MILILAKKNIWNCDEFKDKYLFLLGILWPYFQMIFSID